MTEFPSSTCPPNLLVSHTTISEVVPCLKKWNGRKILLGSAAGEGLVGVTLLLSGIFKTNQIVLFTGAGLGIVALVTYLGTVYALKNKEIDYDVNEVIID